MLSVDVSFFSSICGSFGSFWLGVSARGVLLNRPIKLLKEASIDLFLTDPDLSVPIVRLLEVGLNISELEVEIFGVLMKFPDRPLVLVLAPLINPPNSILADCPPLTELGVLLDQFLYGL